MREVRAVVLGLLVVVLVGIALAFWRRPAREYRRIKGYHVQIVKNDGGSRRQISFRVPMSLVAHAAAFAPLSDIGGDLKTDWGNGQVTAHDIMEAAAQSAPGRPGVITRDHTRIEVAAEGRALDVLVKNDWDRTVRVRVPRALVESLSGEKRISARDILRRLDELGPGEVVVIRSRDDEVTITAEPR